MIAAPPVILRGSSPASGRAAAPGVRRSLALGSQMGTLSHRVCPGARPQPGWDGPVLVGVLGGPCLDHPAADGAPHGWLVYYPAGGGARGDARPYEALVFEMNAQGLAALGYRLPSRPAALDDSALPQVWSALAALHGGDDAGNLDAQAIALGWAARLCGESRFAPDSAPHWERRLQAYIEANWCEALSLSGISAAIGLHPSYVARAFRRRHGCTIGDHVRRYRVAQVCRKLADTDEPLAGLAAQAGFYDQSHFGRCFKRQTGYTPAAFRARFRPILAGADGVLERSA